MVHRSAVISEHQATLRKYKKFHQKILPNINDRAKTRHSIKEAKRSSWRTFTLKINSNTNPKIIWNFIKKISNKNISSLINHLFQENANVTNEKYITNLMADNFAQVISTKTIPIDSFQLKPKKIT